jgi:aerobic carbon-monoxide dehydrogenase large subunit
VSRWVGAAVSRKEDRRMLLGRGRFTGDLTRPRLLHAAFARSPHAHAVITTIDVTAATQAPGVEGVFTADCLGRPYLLAMLERDEFVPTQMPILAAEGDKVRFVGEPVAIVVADDPYRAEDAAELIQVDWGPRPPVPDMDIATAADAPRLHDHGNCLVDLRMFDDDRLPQIFAAAKTTVSATFASGRLAALPLEGRACLAEWDDRDDQLVMHVSTQVPHQVRSGVAQALNLPERAIRVIAPDVGGGFGLKCVVGREEVAVAAAALRLRRPVRWIEDRQENLTAAFHGHEQRYQVKAAFDEDGRIQALDAEIECDTGAYSAFPFTCAVEPLMAATELPGVYKVPAYRARGRAIATSKAPAAPYRGVSRPQIVLVMERLMEKAAAALNLDPLDVRRVNLIGRDDFPYIGVNKITYDEGSYREALDLAEKRTAEQGWPAERDQLRENGQRAGIGYACFSERTAYGTPTMSQRRMRMTPGRSPAAHGQVRALDVAEAAKAPGITAVVTAADLPDNPLIPVRLAIAGTDLSAFLQPVLARDTVRYVGEPLAVVAGEDPYACEDAAELVGIDIAGQPAVLDASGAFDDSAFNHGDQPRIAAELTRGYGDTGAAFAAAAHVVRIELAIGRHSGVPLEPRCLLAMPGPDRGELSIFGMTKVPVWNRDLLADLLGVDETLIRVHAVDAGGGFGVRGEFYPEDFLIPWLAMRLERPVKWVEDRAEHLMAANHSRQQYHRVAAAFDAGGRILGLTDDIIQDNGAYCRTHGVAVPELTAAMLPGPYRVPAYRGRVRVVLTNKTPCGTYRAPGRFEGTAAREHLLDVAATRLGLDPVELRERNLLTPDEIPHERPVSTLGTDLILDTGDYPALLAAAVKEADRLGYRELARRERRGFGLAMFVEKSGLGPQETADVTVSRSGAVHVYSGGTSMGQGIETVLAQIAADALGVDPRTVRVTAGDTAAQPFGAGSWASRSTVVGGSAVHQAATAVRERAIELAGRILEAAPGDLDLAGGVISVRGDPESRLSLADIARAAAPASRYLADGEPAGLSARRRFEVTHMTYPYGTHAAVVEVDTGTGQVRLLRYLVAYEVGRAINPMLVEGQLRGGVAQGIGGALLEEFGYDEAGQPQAVTFIEYRLPTAAEIPPVDVLLSQDAPSPGNPLGVMGAGEGGVNAVGAAVANAVRDALGLPGSVGQLPLTPARVRALAAVAQATGGRS